MHHGTSYRVKINSRSGVLLDMDIHEMVLRLWGQGVFPIFDPESLTIEIEREGVRVEKRLPAWLEHEETDDAEKS